jgi:penicillin amidase
VRRANQQSNWTEFTSAIRGINQPALNLVYADTQGNIGYYVTARAPIRKQVRHHHQPSLSRSLTL